MSSAGAGTLPRSAALPRLGLRIDPAPDHRRRELPRHGYFRPSHAGPTTWVIPLRAWVTDGFAWFAATAKPVTRIIAWLLVMASLVCEALLYRGIPAGQSAIRCHGSRLSAPQPFLPTGPVAAGSPSSAGPAAFYLAVFGLWPDAMQTLAIVMVTVPLAAILGLALGIWATRNANCRARAQRHLRRDAGHAAHGLSRPHRHALRLRAGAGHAGHLRLCSAAHGALHDARHPHRPARHHRGGPHGGLHSPPAVCGKSKFRRRKRPCCSASTRS